MEGVTRERIALGICLASGATAAAFIARAYNVALVLLYTSLVWMQVADWLGGRHWFRLRHATMTQIYQEAKKGTLRAKLPAPASYISRAAMVLLVAAIICFFVK